MNQVFRRAGEEDERKGGGTGGRGGWTRWSDQQSDGTDMERLGRNLRDAVKNDAVSEKQVGV